VKDGAARQALFIPLQFIAENTPGSIERTFSLNRREMTGPKQVATAILKVNGLGESGRAQRLRFEVDKLDGVLLVDINYILDNLTISYNPEKLTLGQIKKKLDPSDHETGWPAGGKAVIGPL
jgi:hypothetical protein